jgi:nucleoside-diphosphate-sugar epimerase
MLTFQALENGRITVFGGDQTRPNIHVKDMVRVYEHFIENPLLDNGSYNAGFENISILEIAERVCAKVDAEVEVSASNDPRSYRQNSDKLLATGFQPRYSVNDAMDDLITLYQSGGLEDLDEYYTVKWMKTLSLGSS